MQNIWLVTVYQVDKNHDFSKDMTLTCNTGCLPSRLVKHACQWETRPPMVRRAGGWNSICADGVRWRQYAPLPSSRPRPHSSLLSKLVVSASSHHPDMTPPAPVLVALALSGFALLSCLGMLAVTLQREIDVEVGAARFSWNSISFPSLEVLRRWRSGWRTWRPSTTTSSTPRPPSTLLTTRCLLRGNLFRIFEEHNHLDCAGVEWEL